MAHGDRELQDVLTALGGRVTGLGEEFSAKGLQGVLDLFATALQDTSTKYGLAKEAHQVVSQKGGQPG
ncbi:MAG: hypothetical protein ACYDEV_07120 [Acidiferrobacter sp.]